MKCWECKIKVSQATMVHYLQKDYYGEAINSKTRDVCPTCYSKLKFNPCHFVEVKSIGSKSIKA